MSDCCTPRGYRWIFSERMARADARRYRRDGLDRTSRRIFDFVKAQGVEGRTVLEVGGGIGAIQIELLKAGASSAVSVELTPTYEGTARELLQEAGLADRVERKVMDFVEANGEVKTADIVIMNRVVCCYPDMPRLAGAAADYTGHLLVMSFPRSALWIRAALSLLNFSLWLTRRGFHVFVHDPSRIIRVTEERGLAPVLDQRGVLWTVAALRRPGSTRALQ